MILSKNQLDIQKVFRETNKNIVVVAVPGSGKTTLILNLFDFVPISKKAIYLAFNKSIVKEIEQKISKNKSHLKVNTLHSLGLSSIYKNSHCKIKIDYYKTLSHLYKLNDEIWKKEDKRTPYQFFILSKMWDLYRLNLCKSIDDLLPIIEKSQDLDYLDEDLELLKDFIPHIEKYNNFSYKGTKSIDFLDMLYIPVKMGFIMNKYDEVFIDECQDLNILQQMLVKKVISKEGRFVAVGDPRQAIYGFMGADKNSFNNFKKYPNTIDLPLSVTYRCGKNIAEFCNQIYPVMEAYEDLAHGKVNLEGSVFDIMDGDYVLCRNNLPLVEIFLFLITQKKSVYIKGKDLGDALWALLKPLKTNDYEGYFDLILKDIEENLLSKGITEPKKTKRYREVLEKISILNLLLKHFQNILDLKKCLEELFIEDIEEKKGIILSTIHKAKGLEANRVFILAPELIPSPYAETLEQLEQEENLKFVAYSRAKQELIFLSDVKNYSQEK